MDAEPAYDPDAVWNTLTTGVKKHLLGLLEPEALADAIEQSKKDESETSYDWVDEYVESFSAHIETLREIMAKDPVTEADDEHFRTTLSSFEKLVMHVMGYTGVHPDQWGTWKGDPNYGPLYDLYSSTVDIYDWERVHLA